MPKQVGAKQTIYIDSCITEDYLWGDRPNKKRANRIFHKIKKSNFKSIIPFVTVGEIINTMIKKGMEEKVEDLIRLIVDLKIDIPPPNKEIIELSGRILNDDERFDPTDAMIAAHALCDEYSSRLVTRDTNILFSVVLEKLEKDLIKNGKRKSKMKITPGF